MRGGDLNESNVRAVFKCLGHLEKMSEDRMARPKNVDGRSKKKAIGRLATLWTAASNKMDKLLPANSKMPSFTYNNLWAPLR